MMAACARAQVTSLYRRLLRESQGFPSYNYRTYALRRVRDAFRANRTVEDPKAVEKLMEEGRQTLELIQRQRETDVLSIASRRQKEVELICYQNPIPPSEAGVRCFSTVSIGKMYEAQKIVVE